MVKLFAIGILVIVIAVVVGSLSFQDQSRIIELEKSPDRRKLEWYAAMAKVKGSSEISFRSPIVLYAVPKSLDDALTNYNLVIAESVQSQSFSTTEDITTWYKFRMIEEISTPSVFCGSCPQVTNVPQEMMPLSSGEFLAAKNGGEVTIDAIKIVSHDPDFPPFEIGKRYLLFMSLDREKMVGFLQVGPWGTYKVKFDDKLEAVDLRLKHPLDEEISNRFGNSLVELKRLVRQGIRGK